MHLSRQAHVESPVRSLLVEHADGLIDAPLLLQEVLRGRLGGFHLERQAHALMSDAPEICVPSRFSCP